MISMSDKETRQTYRDVYQLLLTKGPLTILQVANELFDGNVWKSKEVLEDLYPELSKTILIEGHKYWAAMATRDLEVAIGQIVVSKRMLRTE